MATITLAVPDDIRRKMKEFPEMNWSGLVRKTIEERIRLLIWRQQVLNKIEEERQFSDWTIEMGRKVNKGIAQRLKKEGFLKK